MNKTTVSFAADARSVGILETNYFKGAPSYHVKGDFGYGK